MFSGSCESARLLSFLQGNKADSLVLVGDIIDAWRIAPWEILETPRQDEHFSLIKYLLNLQIPITYITGNHDDFLTPYNGITFSNITIQDQLILNDNTLVLHGHQFDFFIKYARVPSIILTWFSILFHLIDKLSPKFSLSTSHISHLLFYDSLISNYAECNSFERVICGHSHKPGITNVNDISILNCGDWTLHCSAIAQTHTDEYILIYG